MIVTVIAVGVSGESGHETIVLLKVCLRAVLRPSSEDTISSHEVTGEAEV